MPFALLPSRDLGSPDPVPTGARDLGIVEDGSVLQLRQIDRFGTPPVGGRGGLEGFGR